MNDAELLDDLFRQAVAAIDAGDAVILERLLAEHPRLVRDRLESPGEWLRTQIGAALNGFFRHPYLLWFVTEDAVRTGQLSVNVADVAGVIIRAASRAGVADLQQQLDSTLHFTVCSPIGREDGRQLERIICFVREDTARIHLLAVVAAGLYKSRPFLTMKSTHPLTTLAAWAGTWRGSNRLHDPHTNKPEDSPSTLIVSPSPGGQFVRVGYTWSYQSRPQEGSLLLGVDSNTHAVTGHWVDTWHMSDQAMVCRGHLEKANHLTLQGAYACPPGPDWGWRIELTTTDDSSLRVRMFNVSPEGQAQPAVEASYKRVPSAATPDGKAVEHGLSEIGQIAVTVADVGKALPFYRDVLGLRFLFSPGPNLAFLAAGSVRIMLSPPAGAGTIGGNSILYFKVVDLEAVHAAVVKRGAVSERPPQLTAKLPDHELWIGFIRDPDGNLIGLMEEKRP